MLPGRKTIISLACISLTFISLAQHPNREKIDSLKKILALTQDTQKVDCLNALCEEYWWPPRVFPDSILCWAQPAYKEALRINYGYGIATSIMHLGVGEIFRKNFLTAENYLRRALEKFEFMHSNFGLGWGYLWLGQTLYSENRFKESLNYFKRSLSYLESLGDWEGQGKAWAWMGFLYAAIGDYDSSFEYCSKSLLIRQRMSDDVCVAAALTNMGHLYKVAGAYSDALDYYRQGLQYAIAHTINLHEAHWNYLDEPIGVIYRLLNKPDSSLHYLQNSLQIDPDNQMTHISLGETFLINKQYDTALAIFLKPIQNFKKENDKWDLMRVLLDAAKAYEGAKRDLVALQYANESFSIAKEANVKQYILEGYLVLSKVYQHLKKYDSAYYLLKQYELLKDSVMNNQFLWRLSNYKKQADFKKQLNQISILGKDNMIKEEKLRQESFFEWILIICLLIMALTGYSIYKNLTLKRKNDRLESKQKQTEMQQHVTELEMQALRAQMNPHFIFNCLSSINRFILRNETEAASDYLTKFSRLIRMALTNSKKQFISLEDELYMLSLYLDMERLRFKDTFDYSITFTNSIDSSNVYVPPLLLQPFAENAIWHGLMHKDGQGQLKIELSSDNKILTCTITDNGIGRIKAADFKSKSAEKQKSMGLQITAERLALLNIDHKEKTYFNIEDITDSDGNACGTRVVLKLNYGYLAELITDL